MKTKFLWSRLCRELLLLGLPFVADHHVSGADFFVAPGGSDNASGSADAPWRTVQKAADTLAPGDTVYVRAGSYGPVSVHVSGSAEGGFVTFAAYPGEIPVIEGAGLTPPSESTALFLVADQSYVGLRGFELRGYQTADARLVPAGVLITGGCQQVQIRQCQVHDIVNSGGTVARPGNAFGIAVYGTSAQTPLSGVVLDRNEVYNLRTGASESVTLNGNVTGFRVTRNRVHDCNNIGIDFIGFEGTCPDPAQDQARDGLCKANEIWNVSSQSNPAYHDGDYSADGLYCDGAARVRLRRNRVHDCDIGLELASEHAGHATSGIDARHNVVYANRQAGLLLGGYDQRGTGGTDGCKIVANTFSGNDTLGWNNGEVQLRYRTSNCLLSGNTFAARQSQWLVAVPVPAADNTANTLNNNLYYASDGAEASLWRWNDVSQRGFAAWQRASGQDADSAFSDVPPTLP